MAKLRLRAKYRRIINLLVIIFGLLCLIGVVYSSYNIISWKKDVDTNHKITKKLKKNIIIDKGQYKINFKVLKELNKDTIGYIKVNNTNIDYIVVKGANNSYYLNHNFNKEYNIAGWIFVDYRNKLDGTDKNIIIYGHNTKDNSMFETLKDVLTSKWQMNKDNLEITFVTESNTYKYQVFSTYEIKPEDYYLTTNFKTIEDYSNYLNTIRKRSNNDYNIEVNKEDKILTLSSCLGEGQTRVVLHAKLIEQ